MAKQYPGLPTYDDLMNAWKRKNTTQQPRTTMLDAAMEETLRYAQQGSQQRQNVANTLTGGMTQRNQGDIKTWDWDLGRRTILDNEIANKYFREQGLFNTEDYAFNNAYVHLVGDDYLKNLLPALGERIEASKLADEEAKTIRQQTAETSSRWIDLMKASNETEMDRWHDMLMADYLLGDKKQLFDFEAIDNRYAEMSDEEYEQEYKRLSDQWNNLDWETLTGSKANQYESQTGTLEGYRSTVEKELLRGAELEAMQAEIRSHADYGTLSVYNDTYTAPEKGTAEYIFGNERFTNGYDIQQRFMNADASWAQKTIAAEYSPAVQKYLDEGYDYLTPDELADYNALYNAGRLEDAERYLELLRPELLYRRAMVMKSYTEAKATNPYLAVPSWMDARIQNVANVFYLPQQIYETATGRDNPYSSAFDAANKVAYTTGAQLGAIQSWEAPEVLKDVVSYAYQGVTNVTDNTMRLVSAGFNPTASLIIAGLQSASGSLKESAERDDMSAAAKIVKAIGTAAIEVGTEKIGLDALFATGKNGAMQYIKNVVLSELGEETLNYISGDALEAVVAFLFEYEADIKSGAEFWEGLTDTAITTILSSLLMGGGGAIAQDMTTRATGKQLQREGDIEGVLKFAESMPEESASAKEAAPIRELQKGGKKVSTRQLGKLVNAVAKDIGDQNAATVNRIYEEAIEDRLVELGEDAGSAKQLAPVIRRVSKGEQIPLRERAAIAWTDNASQVVKELATETREGEEARVGQSWKAQTQGKLTEAAVGTLGKAAQFREALTSKTRNVTAASKAAERAKALTKGNKGKNKLQAKELAFDDGTKGQGEFKKVIKDGDTLKVGISIDGSDQLKEVSVDSLTGAGDEGLATILEYAAHESRHAMSAEEINIMAGTYAQQGGDAGAFIQQFEDSYLAGYSGVEQKPSSKLMEIAYEHGRYEAVKDEKNRVARAKKARSNAAPTVGWLGDVASDADVKGSGDAKALDEAAKGMTEGQQLVVEFAKNLSRNTGLNIVLFRSKAMDGGSFNTQNGSYDASTNTIYLDVHAGVNNAAELAKQKEEGKLGYAIMRTMGHEVTHAIEATSVDFYDQYKQAVKDELTASGKDWAQLVRWKLDNAMRDGQKLTYAGAEAEVVADASEYMLQDSQFVNNMDAGLKNKVKRIMQDFIGKIRAAFKTLTGGHEESMALRTMQNGVMQYSERLQKLWDAGFMEMATAKVREDQIAEGGRPTQKQVRETAYDYDAIILDEGGVGGYGDEVQDRGISVVVRNSTQVKSATDNVGTFDTQNPDIRYSRRDEAPDGVSIREFLGSMKPTDRMTETEAFKNWFGNSKVVDENGKPLVVYHGTDAYKEFNVFKRGKTGYLGPGIYLTDRENIAQGYANKNGYEGRIYALYARIENPLFVRDMADPGREILEAAYGKKDTYEKRLAKQSLATHIITKADLNKLQAKGYDGIIWANDRNPVTEYMVFDPTQIKSATDNVGTFDPDNPDIRYSRRDEAPDGVSIREFLGNMKPTDRMTETEKLLLKRYQENLRTLEEKEKLVAEQEEIIRTAPIKSDELTMAKNRYQIYRTQANRAARALMDAERSEGFARVMATSQEVVNRYLLGSAGAVGDAADVLDEEIANLTAQLKAVEADVTRTASGQRTAFARGLFDQKQLNEAAQKLKDTYGSRMSVKAIADRLALAYGEIYAENGAEGAKLFMAAARDLAEDMLRGNKYRYKSEILPLLAEQIGTISLTETDVQEIRNRGLTVSEYKRMLSPYIKVVQGGSDLSSYASNAAYYGEGALASVLGEDIEGNLAMHLYDVISREKEQEAEISYEGMSEGQLIAEAMADIAGANLPMSTDSKTVDYLRKELLKYAGESAQAAQKVEQAIMNAQAATRRASGVWRAAVQEVNTAKQAVEYYRKLEEQRRLTELKEQKQEITAQLRSDYAKKLEEKVQKQRTEYREREQKAREYRHSREELDKLRRRIGRNVKRLNTMRMRETDQRHVPQEFQHLANAVMQTFTDSSLAKLAFSAEKTASLARRYRLLQEVESDMTYYWDDEIEGEIENLVALSEAYSAIRERGAGVPSYFSVEGVKLETEILTGVDNIVSNVLQMIDSANDAFLMNRTETFNAYATKTGEEIRKKQDYKQLKGWLGKAQKMLDENIRTGNMTPIYFMEHLNSPLLKEVFDEVRMGQSDYAKIVAQGKDFVQGAKEKYHYGAWAADGKLKMKTSQGHQIELTREEAAELYAIAKRESTNKLYQTEHLLYGGFQYKDITKKGEGLYAAKKESHQLDAADIAKISRWLTDEQKAYADTLVGFLSTTMADYGNAASMEMYGYKKFNETYYIPFHTAAEQRFQRGDEGPQGENAGTGRLKNSGFTKKLQHGANATLVVGGLTDTVSEHIHKMATYAAMVQPIENIKRLLNHQVMEPDGTVNTIRALIGQKYGQASQDYMTQLLKDLNGAAMGDERATDLVNSWLNAFKRGAVMASASVVLQQPTAMARAMAYISPKYFMQNPFYRPGKGTWDEMMKYSGTAVIKDMGKFDVGMGLTARQYIADEHLSAMEAYSRLKADSKWEAGKEAYKRALDWLTAAPGKADQWTWGLIWKAVKAEQAELHPGMDVNSEEFLQMCGDRFDDVIDHTQVYDSVITRSNLMRSKNGFHRMATSFMSEPTLSINMLYDAFLGKHDKKQRGKILGGVIVSQVLAGAMAALVQAWNDDDDKRNWLERYADRATANILDNLNPLGMLPYVSDLMSLFMGYEVERPDMAAAADIIDYGKTFITKAADPDKALTWKDYENFVGTLANMAGLPAKNISREVRRTRNLIVNSQWSAPDAFSVGQAMMENVPFYQSKNTAYYERIVAAELNGDTQKAEDYREYMLLSKMVSEESLRKGLKAAMQEAFIRGDADEDAAQKYLLKIGAYDTESDAHWELDKWKDMRDEGISAGEYRKYADFFQAVETGENLRAVIKEYLDNGVSKTTLASQITTQYKQQLIDMKASGKGYADLQARILTAYEVLGYDRAQKQKDIQKWFEKK